MCVVAGVDKAVDSDAINDFCEAARVGDKSVFYYPEMWHGVAFEPEFEEILKVIAEWVANRV